MPSDEHADDPPVQVLATGGAFGTAVAIATAAYVALDAPAFGVAVGAAMGIGTLLHLPYFLGGEGATADAWHDVHQGAAGLALEVAGVVAFALAFLLGPGIQPLAGGLGVGGIAYLVLATVLPADPAELETAA